ncbi:hypothetical protein NDU88_003924 [Pleurodeles waltl]|uniref:Uncharacterized protein n=1 Tax=Pleurodeles waltl TaxID=8319 RepID=A0AAV7WTV4_PLEWA|nr:hypothetical protein NDU88_003924 [Pleurodeles waltl]
MNETNMCWCGDVERQWLGPKKKKNSLTNSCNQPGEEVSCKEQGAGSTVQGSSLEVLTSYCYGWNKVGVSMIRKRFIASAQGRVSLLKPFKLVTGVPVDERHNYVVTKDRPRHVPSTQMHVSCLPY